MPTSAITALATLTLGSAQATVSFSSISGAYRDLRLVMQVRTSTSSSALIVQANGDTTSTYVTVVAAGNGTSALSSSLTTTGFYAGSSIFSGATSATFITWDFLDYSATDKHKTALVRSGETSTTSVTMTAARWPSTAAITSLVIPAAGDTWAAGSTFTLYGVSA